MKMSPRSLYHTVSIAEAITWTLLILGMLMKYVLDAGNLGVRIGGSLHGLVFLTYMATAVVVGWNQRWSIGQIIFAVATAIVPYATIPFDRSLKRKEMLNGDWRSVATESAKDKHWFNSAMLWFLKHPVLFFVTLIVLIAAAMSVLLYLGPPNTWGKN
ncbi:DUF3817 domain-containing protein [Jonesiaceae bacterium BS-20]|uniref:DUF3817 domain-containing protein n=1 Tax=Jonesiaceae bacterium BS-20 TaxID=3120821 RepID=A0AAU7DX08_9MICO